MWREFRCMTDYFALFDQPRRPWLEPEALKQSYHRLIKATHPDRGPDTNARVDATTINEAYRILLDPRLRLEHLMKLEGIHSESPTRVPEEIADVFLEIGTMIQDIDRLLARSSTTALSGALLQSDRLEKQGSIDDLLEKLESMNANALTELRSFNQTWVSGKVSAPALS